MSTSSDLNSLKKAIGKHNGIFSKSRKIKSLELYARALEIELARAYEEVFQKDQEISRSETLANNIVLLLEQMTEVPSKLDKVSKDVGRVEDTVNLLFEDGGVEEIPEGWNTDHDLQTTPSNFHADRSDPFIKRFPLYEEKKESLIPEGKEYSNPPLRSRVSESQVEINVQVD